VTSRQAVVEKVKLQYGEMTELNGKRWGPPEQEEWHSYQNGLGKKGVQHKEGKVFIKIGGTGERGQWGQPYKKKNRKNAVHARYLGKERKKIRGGA